jgi:hypothetical protein
MQAALNGQLVDHAAILSYSRAITAAVVKTSSVFLAFLLIFLGGIYILMPQETPFALHAESNGAKGSLESSSPGLIIIALGIVLAIATLATKTDITYESQIPRIPPENPAPETYQATESFDFTKAPSSPSPK